MNSLPAHLQPDCAACCGLCCVAPGFVAEQGFAYDKPATEPCRHLQGDYRCAIHAELGSQGFPSCGTYDCHGAGQRATQAFAPANWQASPEEAAAQFALFMRLRPLHELLALLATARAHVTDTAWQRRLAAQAAAIEAECAAPPSRTDLVNFRTLRTATFELLVELGASAGTLALPR